MNKQIANKKAAKMALSRSNAFLTSDDIAEIFRRFEEVTAEPKGELDHVNAYTLLVAVVLSAQATDKGVNKATEDLFKIADTPEKMLELGEENLKAYIKTIGLYQTKAKNVILLSKKLIEDFSGEVPKTREALETLAGVGRKTANVVLNMAFGQKTIAVDTHLFRLANRLGLAASNNVLGVEEELLTKIPEQYLFHAHHWLILHGRYICKAQKPLCKECLINDLCLYEDKTL